jgi:hypothetical protein
MGIDKIPRATGRFSILTPFIPLSNRGVTSPPVSPSPLAERGKIKKRV